MVSSVNVRREDVIIYMPDLEVIGQGATTKIYRDGNTAIKLYENATIDQVDKEASTQRFARESGLSAPTVYGVRKLTGNAVALDMEYIDGKPLIRPRMDKDERIDAIRVLVRLQREVHKVRADGLNKLQDRLEWKIKSGQLLDQTQKAKTLALLSKLGDDSHYLCHGDFHPLNILFDGTQYWIIDWVDAAVGNPLADACRTYVIFKQYMSRSAGIYLKCFCKEANAKQTDVLVWLPVIAAARLNENQDDKSKAILLDIVREYCET